MSAEATLEDIIRLLRYKSKDELREIANGPKSAIQKAASNILKYGIASLPTEAAKTGDMQKIWDFFTGSVPFTKAGAFIGAGYLGISHCLAVATPSFVGITTGIAGGIIEGACGALMGGAFGLAVDVAVFGSAYLIAKGINHWKENRFYNPKAFKGNQKQGKQSVFANPKLWIGLGVLAGVGIGAAVGVGLPAYFGVGGYLFHPLRYTASAVEMLSHMPRFALIYSELAACGLVGATVGAIGGATVGAVVGGAGWLKDKVFGKPVEKTVPPPQPPRKNGTGSEPSQGGGGGPTKKKTDEKETHLGTNDELDLDIGPNIDDKKLDEVLKEIELENGEEASQTADTKGSPAGQNDSEQKLEAKQSSSEKDKAKIVLPTQYNVEVFGGGQGGGEVEIISFEQQMDVPSNREVLVDQYRLIQKARAALNKMKLSPEEKQEAILKMFPENVLGKICPVIFRRRK